MATTTKTAVRSVGANVLTRVLEEGYGPGAWHGADMRAAVAAVGSDLAFRRPSPERHSIAEIALHHAYHAHQVRARLAGGDATPFVIEGDDWFALERDRPFTWDRIKQTVEAAHLALTKTVAELSSGRISSPLSEAEQLELVLGITCHAAYHAGQIQLIGKLA
jgi:DinB superfamily